MGQCLVTLNYCLRDGNDTDIAVLQTLSNLTMLVAV